MSGPDTSEIVGAARAFEELVPGALWLRDYPVRLGPMWFNARMTLIRLRGGEILVHSPCGFDEPLAAETSALGRVTAIIAPGNLHWLHVHSCQRAFPQASTYVCPGVEARAKRLTFDVVLGDEAPALWAGELSQVVLRGTRLAREVAFFHHASRSLILVDLVENFSPATAGTSRLLRIGLRALGMWNRPRPAPEYRFAWGDEARAREGLERILSWNFERVVLAHGDVITRDAHQVVARAWREILR
ncbi:MAG TPA: DUF4336 domain-containing protein [Polyangia bacterium]|nr:DUF4336 domain-containing protein [Polyangia bacterium]